jgi:hypothetical protein
MAAVAVAALLILCRPLLPGALASIDHGSTVLAAYPEPSGAGDTRSAGEAPGFVGAPLLAIGGVLALGALAALGTIAFVRLTGGPGREGEPTNRPDPSA